MVAVTELMLNAGDVLYREGDPNDCGFIVESGEFILYHQQEGQRVDCERRGPGSIIGELSILTGQPRTVTVQALEKCCVFRVSADEILDRFEKLDPILRACIETSINFAATLNRPAHHQDAIADLAPNTLRNADDLIEKFKFENDILKGLTRKEFFMVYQPIVRLMDGQIVGFEALMRWEHPQLGSVPPSQFIEVAETIDAISDLTEFALTQACATLAQIQNQSADHWDMFMSINVSGSDIGRYDFVDQLDHVLNMNGVQPQNIKLEVTETALIPTSDVSERNLARLRSLGYGISIDDFGTGYSNLAYLKTLPLTALKIDRAFAGDARNSDVSRSIVKFLVSLGGELNVDIVAEGIESIEDVAVLRDLGCRFAQGYYFHRPSSKSDILKLVTQDSLTMLPNESRLSG
ncbi:EAL domain-containing protein [Aestuariibius sp. HNIBRBA575]|uniref:EAL domain-containing protein n=1 Tax=Aestuariibius sp. HNIBRBA575 TaxID=3233343 RepID=UPI0034A152CD